MANGWFRCCMQIGFVFLMCIGPVGKLHSNPVSLQASDITTDFNADGETNFLDFLAFAGAFGTDQAQFDLNQNGQVDFPDFLIFVRAYGTNGNTSLPSAFYKLPDDWQVVPIEQQNCAKEELVGVDHVYVETASKLLVWLTGTVEDAHYEPIGEVANYFGFAALRNEIREREGNNADVSFRGAVYKEVLELLDDTQRSLLYELLAEHRTAINGFLEDRVLLVDELWRLKNNVTMDYVRVMNLIQSIGEYEGTITVITAQYYAKLLPLLSSEQAQYLEDIRRGVVTVDQMQNTSLRYAAEARTQFNALSRDDAKLMQEVSSKFVAWATGDLDDALFLPRGKIGNYFGFSSFRYVDRTSVSRGGAAALIDQVLTPDQQAILCGLSTNVVGYTQDYVNGRATLIAKLDALKKDSTLSVDHLITDYADLAGQGEGRRVVVEALTYHLIESMMSPEQIQSLKALRITN